MTAEEILKKNITDNWYETDYVGWKELLKSMEEYADQFRPPDVSGSADLIKFGAYLTGHDDETIKQMLNDYQRHLR